jgi:hypothetical protein
LESPTSYYEAHLIFDIRQLLFCQALLAGNVLGAGLFAGSVDVLFGFFDIVEACWVGRYVGFDFGGGAEDNAYKC